MKFFCLFLYIELYIIFLSKIMYNNSLLNLRGIHFNNYHIFNKTFSKWPAVI